MKSFLKFKSCKKAFGKVLPTQKLTPKQIQKLEELQKQGATLFMKRPKRTKHTDFRARFYAKRSVSLFYGNVAAHTFQKYLDTATKLPGPSQSNLISLLERRLDFALFRLNFVPTVRAAKQHIAHKRVFVNKKIVSSPSYILQPGDIISFERNFLQKYLLFKSMQSYENKDFENSVLRSLYSQELEKMVSYQSQTKFSFLHKWFQRRLKKEVLLRKSKSTSVKKQLRKMKLLCFLFKQRESFLTKKPMHFEVNYKIATAIFLYSPQVVSFSIPLNIARLFSRLNSVDFQKKLK